MTGCTGPRMMACIPPCPVHPAPTYHRFTGADTIGPGLRTWTAWFAAHGVDDLTQVATDGWVVRNVDEHQLVVLEFWTDRPPTATTRAHLTDRRDGTVMRARVVQLDREPDRFPDIEGTR